MDDQHRKITGYHELSPIDIALMNEVKVLGGMLESEINKIEAYRIAQLDSGTSIELSNEQIIESSRCLKIAKHNLQTGMMWLTRSVALPDSF